CLEKDPVRRYPTAHALAADLRRWLAGEPVLAQPEPLTERTRRWVRRRRTALAAAPAAMLGAPVGLARMPALQARGEPRPLGRPRPRAGPVRPGHGSYQALPHRRQPGPPAQGAPIPSAAHQAARGRAGILQEARDGTRGPDRQPLAASDGECLRRVG